MNETSQGLRGSATWGAIASRFKSHCPDQLLQRVLGNNKAHPNSRAPKTQPKIYQNINLVS